MVRKFDFDRNKYGHQLLVDVIDLHALKRFVGNHDVHCLGYYDVTVVIDGHGEFQLDDRTYSLQKNQVLFSRPGQIRCWKTKDFPRGFVLIFEEQFLTDFFNDAHFTRQLSSFNGRVNQPMTLDSRGLDFTTNLLTAIQREIRTDFADNHYLRALLYSTISFLEKRNRASGEIATPQPPNRHVAKFVDLVDRHYHHEHSVRFYADNICVTAKHLNDLIKGTLGITAKQYISNKILREARRLLLYAHDISVTEISDSLGFQNPSYFIRSFRTASGKTPFQYREAKIREK